MQPNEFILMVLPPDVSALGRPDRVEGSPSLAHIVRWGCWIMGVCSIAIAGIIFYFYWTEPPDDNLDAIAMLAPTLFIIPFGGALLWYGTTITGPTSIYAYYRESLAFVWNGSWTVIRWEDVREVLDPKWMDCRYARLVLRDGRKVILRNHFHNPAEFYESVKLRVNLRSRS